MATPFPVFSKNLKPVHGITDPRYYANAAPVVGPQLVKGATARRASAVDTHAAEARLKRKVQMADDAMNYLEAQVANLDAEIAVILARKSLVTRRFAKLEDAAIKFMETTGLSLIDGYRCTWTTAQTPEALDVFDETKVPASYMKPGKPAKAAPDKTAIKAALKADAELVPRDWGCKLTSRTKLNRK